MSVADGMKRLKENLTDSYSVCEVKGATMPDRRNFDSLAECISSVPSSANNTQLTVEPSTTSQTYTPPLGYTGFYEVFAEPVTAAIDEDIQPENILEGVNILGVEGALPRVNAQEGNATPETHEQILIPSFGYNYFSRVTVGAVTSEIDPNIISDNIRRGVSILGVEGSVVPTNTTVLEVNPTTEDQSFTVPFPFSGYETVSVSAVTAMIDINIVPHNILSGVEILGVEGSIVLDGTTIQPTTTIQTITHPDSGGYESIVVEPVTAAIDSDITANNILSGVEILGVEGSIVLDGTTIQPRTTSQSLTHPGVGGYKSVVVEPVTAAIDSDIAANNIRNGVNILGVTGTVIEAKTTSTIVTPSTSQQVISPSGTYNGFSTVTISAVTSAIDSDITANNIRNGVNILGVTGNVVELMGEAKTITPATTTQTVTPSNGKNGLTTVVVNAVTSSIDSDIVSSNIKQGVNILGVTGSVTELVGSTTTITQNGTYTPTGTSNGFTSVNVNVAGLVPTGTLTITANGTYDVTNYASASVNVPNSEAVYIGYLDAITTVLTSNSVPVSGSYSALSTDIDTYLTSVYNELSQI